MESGGKVESAPGSASAVSAGVSRGASPHAVTAAKRVMTASEILTRTRLRVRTSYRTSIPARARCCRRDTAEWRGSAHSGGRRSHGVLAGAPRRSSGILQPRPLMTRRHRASFPSRDRSLLVWHNTPPVAAREHAVAAAAMPWRPFPHLAGAPRSVRGAVVAELPGAAVVVEARRRCLPFAHRPASSPQRRSAHNGAPLPATTTRAPQRIHERARCWGWGSRARVLPRPACSPHPGDLRPNPRADAGVVALYC